MRDSHNEPGGSPGRKKRWERSRYKTAGGSFSYALDINLCFMAGVVCRQPSVAVLGNQRFVWSRLRHIDYGHRRRGIYLPLRFEGKLAEWAYKNLDFDDHIAVAGRLWMGETRKKGNPVFFTWMQVERATCGMPVQLEHNDDYVRVRVDLWNRVCMDAGVQGQDLRVPEVARRTVQWEDVDPYHLDPEVESVPLHDPDEEPEAPIE